MRLFCVVQINKGGKLTLGVNQDHHDVALSLYDLLLWDPCIKNVGIRADFAYDGWNHLEPPLLLFWGLMPFLLLPSCLSTSKNTRSGGKKDDLRHKGVDHVGKVIPDHSPPKGGWGGNPLRFRPMILQKSRIFVSKPPRGGRSMVFRAKACGAAKDRETRQFGLFDACRLGGLKCSRDGFFVAVMPTTQ